MTMRILLLPLALAPLAAQARPHDMIVGIDEKAVWGADGVPANGAGGPRCAAGDGHGGHAAPDRPRHHPARELGVRPADQPADHPERAAGPGGGLGDQRAGRGRQVDRGADRQAVRDRPRRHAAGLDQHPQQSAASPRAWRSTPPAPWRWWPTGPARASRCSASTARTSSRWPSCRWATRSSPSPSRRTASAPSRPRTSPTRSPCSASTAPASPPTRRRTSRSAPASTTWTSRRTANTSSPTTRAWLAMAPARR